MASDALTRPVAAADVPAPQAAAAPSPSRQGRSSTRLAALAGAVGLLITVLASGTAWTLNRRNEQGLLVVQTRQAAAVIASSILGIKDPLATTLQVAEATNGDPQWFRRSTQSVVGPGRLFVSASLYAAGVDPAHVVVSVGDAETTPSRSAEAAALVRRASSAPTFVVAGVGSGGVERVAYAIGDPRNPHFVVFAERAIPANRVVAAETNPAFTDLHFATYLGPREDPAALATTDLPPGRLPLRGDTVRESIPFGDTTLTLVATPRGALGGALGAQLPWIFLAVGVVLTAVTAATAAQLVRQRQRAERDSATISGLYDRLDLLYGEQRGIAAALQHALLPRTNPAIPGLEVATRYVAGVDGVEIGGDWYSLVGVDAGHVAFVIGDVSGRGISAATVMARLRFTVRAYLLEGHAPDIVLGMCSPQLDVLQDAHFATVLVGIADLATREVVVASAGHLPPLVVTGRTARYIDTAVGPPLGVAPGPYPRTTFTMAPGSLLLAFTDGLVERRGEDIDDGFDRLVTAAADPAPDLDAYLARIVQQLTGEGSEDDLAVLAFRWTDA